MAIQIRNAPVSQLSVPTAPPPGLSDQLVESGLIAKDAQFETLYGGRTNQVWKVLDAEPDRVLKFYRSSLQNPLFRNDAQLEAACLHALAATGFVPRLRASGRFGPDRWVFYDHAAGAPWREGTAQVAELLHDLHTQEVVLEVPKGCNGSVDLDHHGTRILNGCRSELSAVLAERKPRSQVPPTPRVCLIHGDPVAGNILVSSAGLTLIDWQCPAMGDPCEDLALFLSPAMQHLYRGKALSPEEEATFLSAYDSPQTVRRYLALKPWYNWRMAAYCLWRAENGAPAYRAGFDLEVAAL
ncbi:phosphotransferase [Ruegeria arenilitoris]|uniref:phosphotransferase n=1 Tax=Ruegeria arenilitoris TaxID=1173585 RepID=UPI0020C426B9|nr:phosphotransferase [Ruegeria arenilitoris]